MTPASRRKLLYLAVAGACCLFLVLLLRPSRPHLRTPNLLIAGRPQMTNGAMLITIVLSNGTSKNLNIVDDGMGNPFVALDAGAKSNFPGTIGFGLTALSNTLMLNLAPGAALTNAIRLTNPPPQFRLLVEVRDLGAERSEALMQLLKWVLTRRRQSYGIPLAYSPWIVNGNISNITQQLKQSQPNGLSQ